MPESSVTIGAAAFSLLIMAAAVSKVDSWKSWSRTIARLVPGSSRLNAAIRIGIPTIEGGIAILLIVDPRLGLMCSALLLASFAVGVFILVPRHRGIHCNCFGALMPSAISFRLAIRNSVLAGFASALVVLANEAKSMGSLSIGHVLMIVLLGVCALLLAEWRRFTQLSARSAGGAEINE